MAVIQKNKRDENARISGAERYLAKLLHAAPSSMAVIGPDCAFTYFNQACETLLTSGEMPAPASLLDIIHPDERESFQFALTRLLLKPADMQSCEIRVQARSGVEFWALAQMSAVTISGHGAAVEILVQLTNIDRQKHKEAEMKAWEERWNSALVSSTHGVWDHDYKNNTMYYSDTWKRLRGLGPEVETAPEVEAWIESVHPDDREHVLEQIRLQNEGEVTFSQFEYRERHADGHWIWIECRGACIEWDEDGRPSRIVGTDTDVTERKATEEKLQHIQRRLELALDVSQIGVFEADIVANTSLWDDRMLSIYGKTGEPHLQDSDSWQQLIHPEDAERAKRRIAEFRETDSTFSNEFRIVRPDGTVRHIRARVAPMGDAGNGTPKVIGANWDVTDDVNMRQELERANRLAEARNRELEVTKAEIEHNALHDFLTDLPNRRYLDAQLTTLATECLASGSGMAILHLDLDRFKQINDTLGHPAGDFMLQYAANVLRENTRTADFVARIGGDEFVILSRFDGNSSAVARLADKIVRRLCEPVTYEGHVCRIGASIGIALDNSAIIDAKQLLLNADIALYRAKSRGRNRHEFFSVDLQNEVVNIKRVSDEILVGLEKKEFIPFYQLQFDAATLDIAGAETLARWKHPTKGILTPDRFLAVAEDLDVVAAIDGSILETALGDFLDWRRSGLSVPKISVNVSTRRLNDPALARKLAGLNIEPGTVSFELLESIFLDDCDDAVVENLKAIRDLGIEIEIDDFGTGHASIVSLLKIEPSTLKIDRALIRPIAESQEQRRLVGSIIEIGKSLSIKVVAEGVETRDHIAILQDLGCDILQGYALARPMPADALADFVHRAPWRS